MKIKIYNVKLIQKTVIDHKLTKDKHQLIQV